MLFITINTMRAKIASSSASGVTISYISALSVEHACVYDCFYRSGGLGGWIDSTRHSWRALRLFTTTRSHHLRFHVPRKYIRDRRNARMYVVNPSIVSLIIYMRASFINIVIPPAVYFSVIKPHSRATQMRMAQHA